MIKAIFFDLDNTLWDHDAAQERTIEKVYDYLNELHPITDTLYTFAKVYNVYNEKAWNEYKKGTVTQERLRVHRFIELLNHYNIYNNDLAIKLNDIYISIYPTWTYLIRGAKELLEELKTKYPLGIITNGVANTQVIKMEKSGLTGYFKWFIYSGEVGKAKPQPEIFKFATKKAHIKEEETLFIGDDFMGDIMGAKALGMKTIWYNPKGERDEEENKYADYIVLNLKEISNIVKSLETC
ncbi:MAG: noncanonical pyrimidine nucleotidase, YjjG family [Epulopiscium sp.]|nr:noncanonical pyrimidine nucleotidase, YjjG family [Candidatus Epulonipiscium sp.]